MKYIDMIAYPIALAFVYVLFGFINWNRDPGQWLFEFRFLWVMWGAAWGYALSLRIKGEMK
jgi:hypothetical protein